MHGKEKTGPLVAIGLASALIAASCGSRTELYVDVPITRSDAGEDATTRDAASDVRQPDHISEPSISCTPRSCDILNYGCGSNGDGCGNPLQCGPCPEPQICGVGGYSQCGGGFGLGPDGGPLCTPKTCVTLGFDCGPAGDGCGGTLQCGICQYPDACGGAGQPGRCGNTLPCTNLCLQQVGCDAGTTSVSGTVVAGTPPQFGSPDPIYNAIVYVPNSAVAAFTPGVQCSQCGADVTGEPLVATQTAPDGTFTLVNMPVGTNIPLVIQLGRWRRQIVIPSVAACANTALPTTLTRMPRTQAEGDIPLTAIATGEADQTECVLMKMGIDQSEFTQPTGGGRVQMYVSNGSDDGPGTPPASQLWSSPSTLATYDIVVLPCEGMPSVEDPTNQQNFINYTSAGGRMFATHYGYEWLYNDAPFSSTANWDVEQNGPTTVTATIDTSFLEGQNFATWLQTVGALSGPNQMQLVNAREDVDSVVPPTEQFIYGTFPAQVLQLGFYTPVGQPAAQQCGRVVYTDFHVNDNGTLSNNTTFPAECLPGPLTAQEKTLEFMLFDLASCVPPPPQNCTPLTCQQQNITCGPAGDGCGGEIQCGSCTAPDTCGGGGVSSQCGYPDAGTCIPKTCAEQGYNCGSNGDGCGNLIDCGTCQLPDICGGGGAFSICGH